MGTDIHTLAQRQIGGVWEDLEFEPFDWRSYDMFGFLCGIRNYGGVTPLSDPRGLPDDLTRGCDWDRWEGLHSCSWLSLAELEAIDPDALVEYRRGRQQVTELLNVACTLPAGEGQMMPLREMLGEQFFDDIAKLKALAVDRVVFGFDS